MDRQPMLRGRLLELRPLRDDDFDALFAISSDPLLWEQHPAKERATEEGFRRWFDDAVASGGALVAVRLDDGQLVGTSRFAGYDEAERVVEIGWTFLAREHWGGPYNREMKDLMLDHAFQYVDTVVFRVHAGNRRSQRAVEKLGAVRSGSEPDRTGRGETVVYRLTEAARTSA